MSDILLFEDKLGISTGYESIWQGVMVQAGFTGVTVSRRSSYQTFGSRMRLLQRKGNRKSPGFIEEPRTKKILIDWVEREIEKVNPSLILLQDPALFFLVNPVWDQATSDNLRGGVYRINDVATVVILSMSAWHQRKSEKDIARLNEGYQDKEEWEEAHGGEEADTEGIGAIWLEPMTVPYGRFVITKDLEKAYRIFQSERKGIPNGQWLEELYTG